MRTSDNGGRADGRGSRELNTVVVSVVAILTIWLGELWFGGVLRAGPTGRGIGVDLSISLAGAQVLHSGGNPYNRDVLLRTERALLERDHMQASEIPPFDTYSRTSRRVGNPPLYFWALEPLTRFRFTTVARYWLIANYIVLGLGFLALLQFFEWRRRVLPLVLFLAMPETVFDGLSGNANVFVFATICAGLALARRYPFLAGLVLSLGWLKVQTALPLAMLMILFVARDRIKAVAGIAAGTAVLVAGTLVATGWQNLYQWGKSLVAYQSDLAGQGDLPTLTALYGPRTGHTGRLVIEFICIAAACGLTAWWWRRNGDRLPLPMSRVAWLWCLWFLAIPFAHIHDETVLAVPVLALLGQDGYRLSRRLTSLFRFGDRARTTYRAPLFALYCMLFGLFGLFSTPISILPVLVAGVLASALITLKDPRYNDAVPA